MMKSLPLLGLLVMGGGAVSAAIRVQIGGAVEVREATFFAFDLESTPFRRNLQLTMVPPAKHPEPVLGPGPEGAPDEVHTQFYGSVIKVGGKYRMWYCGYGYRDDRSRTPENMAAWVLYAESVDGLHWTKPDLGLVEHRGNRHNNIVQIGPPVPTAHPAEKNLHVLYEPDDPDPRRRYKMMLHGPHEGGRLTMVPLFSADGLRWEYALPPQLTDEAKTRFRLNSIVMPNEHLEGGGLVRFGGMYLLNGQAENAHNGKKSGRLVAGYWSPDFVQWQPEKAVSLTRFGFDPAKRPGEGQETHEGVAMWNRGNVVLGVFGMWNGAPKVSDRSVNLGLATSVDALHFREPVTDWVFAKAGAADEWDSHGLLQGQGFEQVGDETWIWHGNWDMRRLAQVPFRPKSGQVGLLRLPRDRFGYVAVLDPKMARAQDTFGNGVGSMMTVPFEVGKTAVQFSANVELAAEGTVRFELLDRAGRLVPGYRATVSGSGLRVPLPWQTKRRLPAGTYRLRTVIERRGPESPKVFAVYVTEADHK